MRHITTVSNSRQRGFTLVEVLVIAPIVVLLIGTMIAFLVSLTGDAIKTQQRVNLASNSQASLDDIETTVRGASTVLWTLQSSSFSSPQGSNDSNAAWNAPAGASNTLILRSAATTKNSFDSTRGLVYLANSPNACNASNVSQNNVATYITIYFVRGNSLWKRTILDAGTTCTTPVQKPSCTAGYNPSTTICRADDEKVMDDVTGLSVAYYNTATASSTSNATSSDETKSMKVDITTSKVVAGETITQTSTIFAKLGSSNVATPPVPLYYSDDFGTSGALGNVKSGTPTVAWQFFNSIASNWSRNSGPYATTTVAASSNPMAVADFGKSNVEVTEGVRSTGNAIYFRVSDAANWLRARINYEYSSYSYQVTQYEQVHDCSNAGGPNPYYTWDQQTYSSHSYNGTTCNSTSTTGRSRQTTVSGSNYNYSLISEKSVAGSITHLGSTSLGSTLPNYIKVTAKGSTITVAYGATSATTSTAHSFIDATNQNISIHGVGYAASSYSSPSGINSFAIADAP